MNQAEPSETDFLDSSQLLDDFANNSARLVENDALSSIEFEFKRNHDNQEDEIEIKRPTTQLASDSLDDNRQKSFDLAVHEEKNEDDQVHFVKTDAPRAFIAESWSGEHQEQNNFTGNPVEEKEFLSTTSEDGERANTQKTDQNLIVSNLIHGVPLVQGYFNRTIGTCQHYISGGSEKQFLAEPSSGVHEEVPCQDSNICRLRISDAADLQSTTDLPSQSPAGVVVVSTLSCGIPVIQGFSSKTTNDIYQETQQHANEMQQKPDIFMHSTCQVEKVPGAPLDISENLLLSGTVNGVPVVLGFVYDVGRSSDITLMQNVCSPIAAGSLTECKENLDPSYEDKEFSKTFVDGEENLLISGITYGRPVVLGFVNTDLQPQVSAENAEKEQNTVQLLGHRDPIQGVPYEDLEARRITDEGRGDKVSLHSQQKLDNLIAEMQHYASEEYGRTTISDSNRTTNICREHQFAEALQPRLTCPDAFSAGLQHGTYQVSHAPLQNDNFISSGQIRDGILSCRTDFSESDYKTYGISSSPYLEPCKISPKSIQYTVEAQKQHEANIDASLKNIHDLGDRLNSILSSLSHAVDQRSQNTTVKVGEDTFSTSTVDRSLSTKVEGFDQSSILAREIAPREPSRLECKQSGYSTFAKNYQISETEARQHALDDDIKLLQNLAQEPFDSSVYARPQSSTSQTCVLYNPATEQSRESKEEGFLDDRGNVVVSKKVTRIVTTTKTVYDSDSSEPKLETVQTVEESKTGESPVHRPGNTSPTSVIRLKVNDLKYKGVLDNAQHIHLYPTEDFSTQ